MSRPWDEDRDHGARRFGGVIAMGQVRPSIRSHRGRPEGSIHEHVQDVSDTHHSAAILSGVSLEAASIARLLRDDCPLDELHHRPGPVHSQNVDEGSRDEGKSRRPDRDQWE